MDNVHETWHSFPLTEVLYRHDDLMSFIFAISSLLPLIIVVFLSGIASAAPLHEPQRLSTLILLMFLVLNVCVNVSLKKLFAHTRPAHPSLKVTYSSLHGMPSDHAQFMMFFACYLIRNNTTKIYNHDNVASNIKFTEVVSSFNKSQETCEHHNVSAKQTQVNNYTSLSMKFFLFASALFVSYGRIYNGYHTFEQVLGGLLIGVIMSVICTQTWMQQILSYLVQTIVIPMMLLCTR